MNKTRLATLTFAIIFAFIVIISRLFYWQIIKSGELRKDSLLQSYKIEVINPPRGSILASDNFPLAQNQTFYQLSIYKPNLNKPISDVFNIINNIKPTFITNNQSMVNRLTNDSNLKWYTFPDYFSYEDSQQLNLPGLTFTSITQRYYPENDLAKSIIGGLERYYNKQLVGKAGFFRLSKDALGNALLLNSNWQTQAVPGQDLHLYLNRPLQYLTETILKDGVTKFQADSGSITIMDPKTGGILAMSSFSATSSATPSAEADPIITRLFEPGSIFKPLVMAAALDTHVIDINYTCPRCAAPLPIGQYTITNWNNELHPNTNLADIIKNSDNIGMSNIIAVLGQDKFLSYYKRLGLNQKSGIDLVGEAKPVLKKNWSPIDLATASFGQGIAITQLQMLTAFTTLADDGYLIKPKMVDDSRPINKIKIYDSTTVREIKNILKYAVNNGVVAKFKPIDMEVCAKSGTAQIPLNGTYSPDNTIASYIGFSPCDNPKFSMIVTIDNPRTSPWGSSTAAPIWYDLAQKISNSPL